MSWSSGRVYLPFNLCVFLHCAHSLFTRRCPFVYSRHATLLLLLCVFFWWAWQFQSDCLKWWNVCSVIFFPPPSLTPVLAVLLVCVVVQWSVWAWRYKRRKRASSLLSFVVFGIGIVIVTVVFTIIIIIVCEKKMLFGAKNGSKKLIIITIIIMNRRVGFRANEICWDKHFLRTRSFVQPLTVSRSL